MRLLSTVVLLISSYHQVIDRRLLFFCPWSLPEHPSVPPIVLDARYVFGIVPFQPCYSRCYVKNNTGRKQAKEEIFCTCPQKWSVYYLHLFLGEIYTYFIRNTLIQCAICDENVGNIDQSQSAGCRKVLLLGCVNLSVEEFK